MFFLSIIHKILADFGIAKLDKVFDANISKKAAINIIRVFAPNFWIHKYYVNTFSYFYLFYDY